MPFGGRKDLPMAALWIERITCSVCCRNAYTSLYNIDNDERMNNIMSIANHSWCAHPRLLFISTHAILSSKKTHANDQGF